MAYFEKFLPCYGKKVAFAFAFRLRRVEELAEQGLQGF